MGFDKTQQQQVERLHRQNRAEEARKQRIEMALDTQDPDRVGRKVWLVPTFRCPHDESDYLIQAARQALPEYHVQLANVDGLTDDDIMELFHD